MFGQPSTKKFAKPGTDSVGSYQVIKRHVMLSCDINDERSINTTEAVMEELGKFTMPVYLNVRRNPDQNTIKHAIESSWCLLCIMTESYEHSAECKKEVMYATQHNVGIIPVRLQGDKWRPGSWLADIAAGKYWVDLSDDCPDDFETKVHNLTLAVKHLTGLEFSGGITPRPGMSAMMMPPARPLPHHLKEHYATLNDAVVGKHGWASWDELRNWATGAGVTIDPEALASVETDLYGNLNIKQLLPILIKS
eukprot:c26806_g1_i1.p1 GENE.c26806_g1_i1~~c26806_g1_i1.p1  ORF type:complete len:251 (+),score=54.59 c26806_g1_i1:31-783(+)